MFNTIVPKVYQQLRERAGLTQAELGSFLGVSRHTVLNIESGRSRLDPRQERRLLDIAKCNRDEFGELLCGELSTFLGKNIGIRSEQGPYEPSTALAKAYALIREHSEGLPAAMRRALNNRINTTQLLGLAYEKNNADLVELTQDCREQLSGRESA